MHVIAEGYHSPEAALCVLRDRRFYNVAQAQWAEQLRVNSRQLYNGADVMPEVEALRDPFTRRRFAAFDIENTVGSNRPRQLLRSRLPQNQIRHE